ncbi:hypothetical protein FSP39_017079 [Pinctada imbricata]|uniref:Uncharacterized protein n=1 Tax=Pinctada imbricata TaxID=66713 RepID=A0AA88YK34_PINIB|nr:hypothetical protein FSP39_017079 [Pinctada imbricata]
MVESSQDNEEIWIAGRLKDEVLGQIGSQLVVNSRTSSFAPCTLGIVCMSTEIIFMFLDMKAGHYDAIQADENVTGFHAVIRYTKSYDIMKADDRNQLSEMLFWLGCVQKQSLDKYFLINIRIPGNLLAKRGGFGRSVVSMKSSKHLQYVC